MRYLRVALKRLIVNSFTIGWSVGTEPVGTGLFVIAKGRFDLSLPRHQNKAMSHLAYNVAIDVKTFFTTFIVVSNLLCIFSSLFFVLQSLYC